MVHRQTKEYQRARYAQDPDRHKAYVTKWGNKNPKKVLMYSAKSRAKSRGLEFSIGEGDFDIPEICPVLGIVLGPVLVVGSKENRQRDNAPSLDRINSALGYVPGNARVISWRANDLKKNGTLEEMLLIVQDLKRLEDR